MASVEVKSRCQCSCIKLMTLAFSKNLALYSFFREKKKDLSQCLHAATVKQGNFAFQNVSKLHQVVKSSSNLMQMSTIVQSQLSWAVCILNRSNTGYSEQKQAVATSAHCHTP